MCCITLMNLWILNHPCIPGINPTWSCSMILFIYCWIQIASVYLRIFFNFGFIYLFIYLFMAVLGLRYCMRAFSSCGKWGPLFIAVRGPLIIAASLVVEHRLQMRRLSNVAYGPSCSVACGILPDQGSNLCPLHWQADSQPLCHQGSPYLRIFASIFIRGISL